MLPVITHNINSLLVARGAVRKIKKSHLAALVRYLHKDQNVTDHRNDGQTDGQCENSTPPPRPVCLGV